MLDTREGKVIIVHPLLTSYRMDFFERIAAAEGERFFVYASEGEMGVLTENTRGRPWVRTLGPMKEIAPGVQWQRGTRSISLGRQDIIVIPGAPRCVSNLALFLRARRAGAQTVWWGHLWSATSRTHRYALRLALMRLADALLFYTEAECSRYRDEVDSSHTRVYGLNNGIQVEPIQRHRVPYDPHAREHRVLFLGRLTPKASLHLMLDALTFPELEHVLLDVIGDGEEGAYLRERARKLGLEQRIHWHGASKDEARIAAIANQCAAFVYPGGVGLSLIHAMAYGLPAVVHDHAPHHMPEIAAFIDDVTGVTFKKGDARSLARNLARMLESPDRRQSMSHAARERADHDFNTAAMAERFLSMVDDLRTKRGTR